MTTQIKKTGGSFASVTLTATGLVTKASVTALALATNGNLHQAYRAVNQWHNAPANATNTANAQKAAVASGANLQEI